MNPVLVTHGAFNAVLGANGTLTDAALIADDSLWLAVTVGGATSDRVALGTAPYAAVARYAQAAGDAAKLAGLAADRYVLDDESIPWSRVTGAPPVPAPYTVGDGLQLSGGVLSVKTSDLNDDFRAATWTPAWGEVTGVPAAITNRDAATLAGQSLTDLDTRYQNAASLEQGPLAFGASPGGGYGYTGLYGTQIEFGRTFSTTPILVTGSHEINDNGAVGARVTQISRRGAFTRNYCSGQELQPDRMAWFAIEPGSHTLDGRVVQAGRLVGGGNGAGGTNGTYSVTFPTAYAAAPAVFLMVDESGDDNGALGCRVTAISATGFTSNCWSETPIQQYAVDALLWVAIPTTGTDPIDYRGHKLQVGECTTGVSTGSCSFSVPFDNTPSTVIGQIRELDNNGAVQVRTIGRWSKTAFTFRSYTCGSGDTASERLFWLAAD